MKDFYFTHSWFDKQYRHKPGGRFHTFKTALNLYLQSGGTNIVETGCIRQKDDFGAGYSTYLFGEISDKYGGNVYSVDINENNLKLSAEITKEFAEHMTFICEDSVRFFKNLPLTFEELAKSKIDLLYLDSMDAVLKLEEGDPEIPQKHNLAELMAALPYLHEKSVILLDDSALPFGGKTKLSNEWLLDNGYTLILDDEQSLFMRI